MTAIGVAVGLGVGAIIDGWVIDVLVGEGVGDPDGPEPDGPLWPTQPPTTSIKPTIASRGRPVVVLPTP